MKINADSLVSIAEANQNFSRVACSVDETGSIVILKNVSHYLVIDFQQTEEEREAADKDILSISSRLICQRRCDFVIFRRTGNVRRWRIKVCSL